ncbi:hypothetical protein [Duganella sp. BJB1802]|uniref:hypothetical protein n=1 Tax=Duganella sp. BJB1802 TaxID=2744575 RepID=UPI001E569304|nr:hypothetical protein [Duganella sp. BJB1802]
MRKPAYEEGQKMDAIYAAVGIDVSKRKLDIALLVNGKTKTKVLENPSKVK